MVLCRKQLVELGYQHPYFVRPYVAILPDDMMVVEDVHMTHSDTGGDAFRVNVSIL